MARDQSRPGQYRRLASSHEFTPVDLRGVPRSDAPGSGGETLIDDLLSELEDSHPADDELDTGAFRAVTDEYIQAAQAEPPSVPPLATFSDSEELRGLNEIQDSTRNILQNITMLMRPPPLTSEDE